MTSKGHVPKSYTPKLSKQGSEKLCTLRKQEKGEQRSLSLCYLQMIHDNLYKIFYETMKWKDIEVISWAIEGIVYDEWLFQGFDPANYVFVAEFHGTINASGLAKILDDTFQNTIYAATDTDTYNYSIVFALVTFST